MKEVSSPKHGRTLDPLVTLVTSQYRESSKRIGGANPCAVTGACFLSTESSSKYNDGDSSNSSDSDFSYNDDDAFRCRRILRGEKLSNSDGTASARESAASFQLLQGRYLTSCHVSGDAYLWDLGARRVVNRFVDGRGPGLAIRRMGDDVMYHTRDDAGTVSIHSFSEGKSSIRLKWETGSRTFCKASPCEGNSNLFVLPSDNECYATVRDVRLPPDARPVYLLHGTGDTTLERTHGMLSSLAMCMSDGDRPILACGMESGSIFFHDLRVSTRCCGVQVSPRKDPILGMDISTSSSGALAIVGLGADTSDLMELAEGNRGTVATVKVTTTEDGIFSARVRNRVGTCNLENGGKPGVNTTRFRPDGRLFAIGGWDHRLRIFDRVNATPMAILRGHSMSVTAIDWSSDAVSTGLLATGAGDGKILLWRCFPSTTSGIK